MARAAPVSKRQRPLPAVVWAASQASARSYTSGATEGDQRRSAAGVRKWRTSGTVSIRQAEAASAIGTIEPVSLIAHAPTSKATLPPA